MMVFLDALTLNKPEIFIGGCAAKIDDKTGELKDDATGNFIDSSWSFQIHRAPRRQGVRKARTTAGPLSLLQTSSQDNSSTALGSSLCVQTDLDGSRRPRLPRCVAGIHPRSRMAAKAHPHHRRVWRWWGRRHHQPHPRPIHAEKLGQAVVIENWPGAGGTIGNEVAVARADKDGYTLGMMTAGQIIAATTKKTLRYDTLAISTPCRWWRRPVC